MSMMGREVVVYLGCGCAFGGNTRLKMRKRERVSCPKYCEIHKINGLVLLEW